MVYPTKFGLPNITLTQQGSITVSLPYASIQDLSIHFLPLTLGINAYHDVYIEDIENISTDGINRSVPNGVYRLISRTFLRWLDVRIKMAAAAGSGVSPEAQAASLEFFNRCCEVSGLAPSEKTLPSGYTRPSRSSAFEFKGSFCVWQNTTPNNALIGTDSIPMHVLSSSGVSEDEILPGCPTIYPICRGPGIETKHYRFDQIPHQATEYMQFGGGWLPIMPHWTLAKDVKSKGAVGIWCAPEYEADPSISLPAKNPLDDLL